jgi:hypothetical protein
MLATSKLFLGNPTTTELKKPWLVVAISWVTIYYRSL